MVQKTVQRCRRTPAKYFFAHHIFVVHDENLVCRQFFVHLSVNLHLDSSFKHVGGIAQGATSQLFARVRIDARLLFAHLVGVDVRLSRILIRFKHLHLAQFYNCVA